jgi:hypothetical protein
MQADQLNNSILRDTEAYVQDLELEVSEPELKDSPKKKRRNLLLSNEIKDHLRLFTTKKGKPLKKEYLRVGIIRQHKKSIRNLEKKNLNFLFHARKHP